MKVATYNLGDGPDAAKVADLDKIAAHDADVICLQEAGDRQDVLRRWAKSRDWQVWFGSESMEGASSVPILHRITVGGKFSRLAVDSMWVGPGAGPDVSKPKVVNGVRAGRVAVLNTHFIASATRKDAEARRRHYRRQVAVLADMSRNRIRRDQCLVVAGDFNAEPDFELLDPLRALGLRQRVNGPTLGNRCVDLVWTHGLRAPDSIVIRGLSSNHDAPLVSVKEDA